MSANREIDSERNNSKNENKSITMSNVNRESPKGTPIKSSNMSKKKNLSINSDLPELGYAAK